MRRVRGWIGGGIRIWKMREWREKYHGAGEYLARKEEEAMKIKIDEVEYKVVEKLSEIQCGFPAVAVDTATGERIAVKRGGVWQWWRVQVLIDPKVTP